MLGGPLRGLLAVCILCVARVGGGGGSGGGSGGGTTSPPGTIILNPSANTFLGAVVALRSRGSGLFGCGTRTREGSATLSGLQRLVEAVNSGQPNAPSVPKGVSLGVRVFDHCGRPRVAVSQLTELLPELGPGGPPVAPPAGPRTVGILDGAGLTRTDPDADLEVRHALAEAMVPVAAMDSSHLVQTTQRAQALVAVLQRLSWRRFVVVRGSDAYSEDLWQSLSQLAAGLRAAELCVDSVETFPTSAQGEPLADTSLNQEVMGAVTDAAVSGLPVLVLLPRAALRSFLAALKQADMPPAAPAALMLLLADLVAREDADLLPHGATVYSLATSADGVPALQALQEAAGAEDGEEVDSLSAVLRTDALLAAAQPVLTFALALRRSWRNKCPGKVSGSCPPWSAMSRPEFLNSYFAPLAAAIARGDLLELERLEPDSGWERRWLELLLPPRHLTLYRYHHRNRNVEVRAVLRTSGVNATVLDDNFNPEEVGVCATRPSVASAAECERTCLPLHKHSRTGSGRRIESWANYQDVEVAEEVDDNHLERDEEPDFQRLLESPQGVYLALFVALRSVPGSEAVLDCPLEAEARLDLVAVRRVEAFLWALQRLNQQLDSAQLQVGALLADTCGSQLRAMALAARLRPVTAPAGRRAERVLAVVNALPPPAARQAADILAERNITSISTGQLLNHSHPYQLQVDLPLTEVADAMVQTLLQLGWSYVSVVTADSGGGDPNLDHVQGQRMFLEAAAKAGICIALQVSLPAGDAGVEDAVTRLLGARADGARGVVVWGDGPGLRALFRGVTHAIAHGSLRREDLFWILASPSADGRELMQDFGNVLAGAAIFSPQRRGVAEFQHFLRQETIAGLERLERGVTGADTERRWLRYYQEQCGSGPCPADEAAAGDWGVVQAVGAVGAVVSQLAACPHGPPPWEAGGEVCLPGGPQDAPRALPALLPAALRWTASPRADGPVGAEFRFSPGGAGILAVEVDNLRRRAAGGRSRSLGDINFQRVGSFSGGKLSPLDGLVAYKDSGDEVRVSTLTSQCGGAQGSCHRCRLQRGQPNSALGDWIVVEPPPPQQQQQQQTEQPVFLLATIDVHEPSSNPLQCGQEINPRGLEQLEAFLWAVDQVNTNSSGLRVGAVALDTCGSAARTAGLVSEVLGERVVAVVAGGSTLVAAPALEAAGALGLAAVAPSARGPAAHRKTHPPYPLQLAPSNTEVAASLVALLSSLHWRCVAALYLQDAVDYEETFRQVDRLAQAANISVQGVAVPVSVQRGSQSAVVRQALLEVQHQEQRRGLALLLPGWCVDLVLRAAAALQEEGLWSPEGVTLVVLDSDAPLLVHGRHALGSLVLRPRAGAVPEFERHFRGLTLDHNTRNPWFPEFWSGAFHCRGSGCRAEHRSGLQAYQMQQNSDTPNMINSVLGLGHALQSVRRELCPDSVSQGRQGGPCRAMASLDRVRARLLEVAPKMAFVGAGLNPVAFSSTGENTKVALEVLNVQMSAHSTATEAVRVGEVAGGVVTGLGPDSVSAPPACPAAPTTPAAPTVAPSEPRYLMELPGVGPGAGQPAPALLVLVAAHGRGDGPLQCGVLDADALCQLAGAMFAVHRVNHNDTLLQGQAPKLGLVAVDTCGQAGRAYSSVFTLLSGRPSRLQPVAALVLDGAALAAPAMVGALLDTQAIALLRDPGDQRLQRQVEASPGPLSRALLDLAMALQQGSSLVVLHGASARARSLARHLESASLARCSDHHHNNTAGCLSAVLPMPGADNSRSGPQYLLSTQPLNAVVILALDRAEDLHSVLLAAQSSLVPRLVFLAAPPTRDTALRADGHSVLSVVPDASVSPGRAAPRGEAELDAAFQNWLSDLSNPSMPPTWTNSFRDSPCDLDQDPWRRPDIVAAVERVARGVRWAASNASATNMSAMVSRFLDELRPEGAALEAPAQVATFRLWRGDEAMGSWSPEEGLTLNMDPSILALDEVSVSGRPTLFHNLQYAWAVSLGVLALLGVLATLLTAVFFLSAAAVSKTPISGGAGTSVLGYLILLGLLLLQCAVLSLVLAPAEVTCCLRRLLPALAYAFIFAAMFLKVLTTWQVCDRKGGVVRPLMLVLRALLLAGPQALVSAGWLVLVPPSVHTLVPAASAPTYWQCYGAALGDRDTHLLLSLAYTCLLAVATAVLALLCSSKEELLEEGTMLRQESRWILVSAVAVTVQLSCWGLALVAGLPAALALQPPQRDLLAASVHALAAATLLLCLFLPKLRLYLRLRRDARNTAAIAASAAARSSRNQPIYGISHFQPFGGKLNPAFDAPSMDMSLGESASQPASDCGSEAGDPTQVIPSSLYSIDMFSSQDSSSQGITDVPMPVVVAMATADGRGTVRGTIRSMRSVRAVHQVGTIRSVQGGTLRGLRGTNTLTLGGTVRGTHFLPGSNEFTAPHKSSSMLLLPGQESISYM